MKFSYILLKEKKLLLERIEGPVTLEGLKRCIFEVWQNPDYDPSYSGLLDLTKADVIMGPAELEEVSKLLLSSSEAATGSLVLLVDKPMETALSMLFENKMAAKNPVLLFSEPENAMTHYGLSRHEFEMLGSEHSISIQFDDASKKEKS